MFNLNVDGLNEFTCHVWVTAIKGVGKGSTTLSLKSKRKPECHFPCVRESEPRLQEEVLKIANYFRVLGHHHQFIEYLLDTEGVSRFDLF